LEIPPMFRGFVFVAAVASMVVGQAIAAPKAGSAAVNHTPTRGISKLSESQCTNGGGTVRTGPSVSIFCGTGKMCSTFRDGEFVHECIDDVLPN
jgi:hypothetical protein